MNRILYNAIQTPDGTIIQSKHTHDYVTYIDKNGLEYMVDGGTSYLRRTVHEEAPHKELSIEDDGTHELRRSTLRWGRNYDKDMNRLPETEWVTIQDMNSEHIQAIIDGNYAAGNKYMEDIFKEELKYRENVKDTSN